MKNLVFLVFSIVTLTTVAWAQEHDVVILNGRVMDPQSGFDDMRNVGVKDGRIVTITEKAIEGTETIDASGHAVVPGFVDTHIHGQSAFSYKMFLRDGMTTALSLENGSLQIAKFYEDRAEGALMNYGTGVSHEFARIAVMDGVVATEDSYLYPIRAESGADGVESWNTEVPTDEQVQEILEWLHQGVKEGALMVNSMPGYIRDTLPTKELWEVQKIAAEYGRGVGLHPRFGPFENIPNEYTLGYKEAIANAAVLGHPIILSHNNNRGWEEIIEMTVRGRENGMVIWSEQYPYTSGGPNAGATILEPENFKAMGFKIEESVLDPSTGKYPTEAELIDLRKTDPGRPVVAFLRPKDWPAKWCATPEMALVNDSFSMLDKDNNFMPVETAYEDYVGHQKWPPSVGQ